MESKYDKEYLKAFGKHVAKKRKEKGISQESLSFEAGLDVMTISRIERGLLNVSVLNLVKIAHILEIHPKKLLEFDPP